MDCVMGSFVYRIIRHENFQSATSDLYLSFYQTFIFHMTVLYFFSVFRIPSFCGGYRTTFRRRAGTTQWKNADENAVIQTVFQDLQNPSREGRFFLIDARRFIGCIPEDHLQRNIDLSERKRRSVELQRQGLRVVVVDEVPVPVQAPDQR